MRPSQRANASDEMRAHAGLRQCDAGPVDVRAVAAQDEQALPAELGQPSHVGGDPVDRGLVELVVAGDQRRAKLAGHGHGERVRDRVGHLDHLEGERADLDRIARS